MQLDGNAWKANEGAFRKIKEDWVHASSAIHRR